jgi:hypothetical protein
MTAQIAQAEEKELGQEPAVPAEIGEARAVYQAGDYVTMSSGVILEKVEQQVAKLRPQEQLQLLEYIARQLRATPLGVPTGGVEEQARKARLAEVEAWLAECDAVAASIAGEFDSAEDLRRIREERASRL